MDVPLVVFHEGVLRPVGAPDHQPTLVTVPLEDPAFGVETAAGGRPVKTHFEVRIGGELSERRRFREGEVVRREDAARDVLLPQLLKRRDEGRDTRLRDERDRRGKARRGAELLFDDVEDLPRVGAVSQKPRAHPLFGLRRRVDEGRFERGHQGGVKVLGRGGRHGEGRRAGPRGRDGGGWTGPGILAPQPRRFARLPEDTAIFWSGPAPIEPAAYQPRRRRDKAGFGRNLGCVVQDAGFSSAGSRQRRIRGSVRDVRRKGNGGLAGPLPMVDAS